MQFEFATATRIIFGPGRLRETGHLVSRMGNHALVVLGVSGDLVLPFLEVLKSAKITVKIYSIPTEPTIQLVREGVNVARKENCDCVIGFGGGSAIDAGKAIAALCTNPGEVLDYLEVIGDGNPLINPPLPFIAIPTTAGTGAEVTRNAVLASPEHRVKVSLRSPLMLPSLAVVDPELTFSLPPALTASTGLDALTQCIEPFVSSMANPLTDAICRDGISRAARSLKRAYERGNDIAVRVDMSLASLFGGLALANAKLGAVHGFAGVIGGMYPNAPHGVICGLLLPLVIRTNVQALQERTPDHPALARFTQVACLLTGDPSATSTDGVIWVSQLCDSLNLPPFSTCGIREADLPMIVENASRASSMKGNPVQLTQDELTMILRNAF